MVRLKSRLQCPPNGFLHKEKATGWQSHVAVPHSQWSFETCCQAVLQHRLANPELSKKNNLSTDINVIRDEVDEENAVRTLAFRGGEIYIQQDSSVSPKILAHRSGRENAAGGLNKYIKNTLDGAAIWAEWFGEGMEVVPIAKAEERAQICLKCPHHVPGDFKQRWNETVAKEILSVLSMLKDINFRTRFDSELKICDACDCPMRAKIWTPIEHIRHHLKDDVKKSLWSECWIPKE